PFRFVLAELPGISGHAGLHRQRMLAESFGLNEFANDIPSLFSIEHRNHDMQAELVLQSGVYFDGGGDVRASDAFQCCTRQARVCRGSRIRRASAGVDVLAFGASAMATGVAESASDDD